MQRHKSDDSSEAGSRRRVFFDDDTVEEERALWIAQAETEYNRQLAILEQFEENDGEDGTWSGCGCKLEAHIEDLDDVRQQELRAGTRLKEGWFGTVSKVTYRNVELVRKMIPMSRFSKEARKLIRQEGSIGQSLDSHRHIIKLIGTFWEASDDPFRCTFNILTFPVAVCDLEQMLVDCEEFSVPQKITGLGWASVIERLAALNFNTNKSAPEMRKDMKLRLQEIMGCLTEGVVWMHSQRCQHRDIKPANVLVRPGRVLITDFGISRDRRIAEQTTTELHVGYTLGYAPPEVLDGDATNPEQADIYSLGCVFLRIWSVIHGPNQPLKMISEEPHPHSARFRERQFKEWIAVKGRQHRHQILPLQYQELLASMLEGDRYRRPAAETVNYQLREWSSNGEHFHGPCCRPQPQEQTLSPTTAGTAIHDSNPPPEEDVAVQLSLFANIYEGRRTPTHHLAVNQTARPSSYQSSRATSSRPAKSSDATSITPVTTPNLSTYESTRPTQLRPMEKKWFRILNRSNGVTKALQVTSGRFLTVAEPKQGQQEQLWQFDMSPGRADSREMTAYMFNLTLGPVEHLCAIDLGGVPSIRVIRTKDAEWRDAEVVLYQYFQATPQQIANGWSDHQSAMLYLGGRGDNLLGHDGETVVRRKLDDLPPDRFWFLEEADMEWKKSKHKPEAGAWSKGWYKLTTVFGGG